MALNISPPDPPPSSGGTGSGKSGGKGRTTQVSPSSSPSQNPWVVFENGKIHYVKGINPPANALKAFGLPIKRSDFLQARAHYGDLFRAWLGRKPRSREVARILRRGTSDYVLKLQMTRKKGFHKSAIYRHYQSEASRVVGGLYKPTEDEIRESLRNGGNLMAALAHSRRAQRAVANRSRDEVALLTGGTNYRLTRREARDLLMGEELRSVLSGSRRATSAITRDFRKSDQAADVQYALGAFGGGRLDRRELRNLAVTESGLKQTALGKQIITRLEKAMARQQRLFAGSLASPSLSLEGGRLNAPSLSEDDELDLPA